MMLAGRFDGCCSVVVAVPVVLAPVVTYCGRRRDARNCLFCRPSRFRSASAAVRADDSRSANSWSAISCMRAASTGFVIPEYSPTPSTIPCRAAPKLAFVPASASVRSGAHSFSSCSSGVMS
jgi:hypothetical protein